MENHGNITEDRQCQGPGCQELFASNRSDKIYCSYQCYEAACKVKNAAYMKQLRSVGLLEKTKICKNCEEPFTTTSAKKIYCKYECYREATLEKNKAYMTELRAKWRAENPAKSKDHECTLCPTIISHRKKYCDDCRKTALAIYRKNKGFVPEEVIEEDKHGEDPVSDVPGSIGSDPGSGLLQ